MNVKPISAGLMSAILACTGGAILVVQVAEIAGLSKHEMISWFSSVYVLGGLLNLLLTVKYRIPFAGAHSITAIAFLASVAGQISFAALTGGFIIAGALVLLTGWTGWFAKALKVVPKQIIDALLAGLLLHYIAGIVPAVVGLPVTGALALFGYFLFPKIIKNIPPGMAAFFFGTIGFSLEYSFPSITATDFMFPMPIMPEFTLEGLFSAALPIALLVLTNDCAVALTALKNQDYDPPVNKVLVSSGAMSMIAGLFGGHAAAVGGMMSALCSSPDAGPKKTRPWAAIVSNGIVICFGLAAWKVIDLIQALPPDYISMMTGFSLLGLFITGLRSVFSNPSTLLPGLITFIIAGTQIRWLGIATPVWALGGGMVTLQLIQRSKKQKQENES